MGLFQRARLSTEFLRGKLTLRKVDLFLKTSASHSEEHIKIMTEHGLYTHIEFPQEIIEGMVKRLSAHQVECYKSNPFIQTGEFGFETIIYALFRRGSDTGIRIFYNPNLLIPLTKSAPDENGDVLGIHIGQFSRPYCYCFKGYVNMSGSPTARPTPEAVTAKILSVFDWNI